MSRSDWSGWSDWRPFVHLLETSFREAPEGFGAYAVGIPMSLHRARGKDQDGLLHVGESTWLRWRLRQFWRCITNPQATGHMAGWRFTFFHFERYFRHKTIRVRWTNATNKETAYFKEGKLLYAYLGRHCELPPLNYKFNWSDWERMSKKFA